MRHFSTALLCLTALAIVVTAAENPTDMINALVSSRQLGGIEPSTYTESGGSVPDNSIDPQSYIIGSGDEFSIYSLEHPSIRFRATVNQNCDILIPGLGIMKIGRSKLGPARDSIASFVSARIKGKSEVYVSFEKVKLVSAAVTGLVSNPGTYTFNGTLRVSDAIARANQNSLPSVFDCDYRQITIRRIDTVMVIDLFKYLFRNDLNSNPYVYSGDQISLLPPAQRVRFYGEIRSPIIGCVPIRTGETAAEFLSLFLLSAGADSSAILIQQGSTESNRKVSRYSWNELSGVVLQDQDVINVQIKENYPRYVIAYVNGEVTSPGQYAISAGKTNTRTLIQMAGGLTSRADTGRIVIIRQSKRVSPQVKAKTELLTSTGSSEIGSIRPEMNLAFSRLARISDYSILSVASDDSLVEFDSEDRIFVPAKDGFVYVSGSVGEPRAVPYQAGKSLNYYVSKAGGYSRYADRGNTYVATIYDNVTSIKNNRRVERGDIVLVPDEQRNRALTTVILPIIQAIATTATVVLGIISLRK